MNRISTLIVAIIALFVSNTYVSNAQTVCRPTIKTVTIEEYEQIVAKDKEVIKVASFDEIIQYYKDLPVFVDDKVTVIIDEENRIYEEKTLSNRVNFELYGYIFTDFINNTYLIGIETRRISLVLDKCLSESELKDLAIKIRNDTYPSKNIKVFSSGVSLAKKGYKIEDGCLVYNYEIDGHSKEIAKIIETTHIDFAGTDKF